LFEKPAGPVPVLITLGSNITPAANLNRAGWMLRQNHHLIVRAVSRVYESAPINAAGEITSDQGPFLNAAVLVETDYYSAFSLKYNVLRFIEKCLGRVRTADRFAPRPIDLDIALYGDRVIDDPRLTVPDPDILRRAHVALPLADLAPEVVHPVTGQTLAAIAAPFRAAAGIAVREDINLEFVHFSH
jgi:2-amino-4-hydroxy-6-hydroxymethyldihydropteridine diphosphokinase